MGSINIARKVLSTTFSRPDIAQIKPSLRQLADSGSLGKAGYLLKSFLNVSDMATPCEVHTVLSLFKPEAAPVDTIRPEFLRTRIEQLEDLFSINPNVSWRLTAVYEPHECISEENLWKKLLSREYPHYMDSGRVRIARLPEAFPSDTFKGAGIVFGMRIAIEEGADYVIMADAKPAIDLCQEGLVLEHTVQQNYTVSIGSRYMPEAAIKRDWHRVFMSRVFSSIKSGLLPSLKDLKDTQCPLKCFSATVLRQILPFSEDRIFDPSFDYGLSFDTELLTRTLSEIQGSNIAEIPLIFQWTSRESLRIKEAMFMLKGLWDQHRKTQKVYKTGSDQTIETVVDSTGTTVDFTKSIKQRRQTNTRKYCLNVIANYGEGSRMEPLTSLYGSKGDVVVFGEKLSEIGAKNMRFFSGLLPKGDWYVWGPSDLALLVSESTKNKYANMIPENSEVVVMGFPEQDRIPDPPFAGFWATRLSNIQEIKNRTLKAMSTSGIVPHINGKVCSHDFWHYLIRPSVLTLEQWQLASGHKEHSQEQWLSVWNSAKEFSNVFMPFVLPCDIPSININSPADILTLSQMTLSGQALEDLALSRRIRALFGINAKRQVIDSQMDGAIVRQGNCLVRNSFINIPDGMKIVLGNNVIIDGSLIDLNKDGESVSIIPAGTVIMNSRIRGLSGSGKNSLVHSVDRNMVFFTERSIQVDSPKKSGPSVQYGTGPHFPSFPKSFMVATKRTEGITSEYPPLEILSRPSAPIRFITMDWHRTCVHGADFWTDEITPILKRVMFGNAVSTKDSDFVSSFVRDNSRTLGSPGLFKWAFLEAEKNGLSTAGDQDYWIDMYADAMQKRRKLFLRENPGISLLTGGVLPFFRDIKEQGIGIGILSNGYYAEIEREIEELGIRSLLSFIIGRHNHDGQPTSEWKKGIFEMTAFNKAVSEANAPYSQIAFVDDSTNNIGFMKSATVIPIGFAQNSRSRNELADSGAALIINGDFYRTADEMKKSDLI